MVSTALPGGPEAILLIVGGIGLGVLLAIAAAVAFARRRANRGPSSWTAATCLPELADLADLFLWETDDQGRIRAVSRLPVSMGDISVGMLVGESIEERFLVDVDDNAHETLAETWRRRLPFRNAIVRLAVPGVEARTLRIAANAVFDAAGKFAGYRGSAIDVSEQVEAERRSAEARRQVMDLMRQARDAAIQENHGKTRFLAAASHDLRQPLQALGLFVATLALKPLPDDLKRLVDRIQTALGALEHLIDTLLDISRFDAGVVEAHAFSFPLQDLFGRLAPEFEPLAENKGLTMRFLTTSAMVRSDPVLLERILRNLIGNAVRYTVRGGVLVGCRRRSDGLHIEVWDTGPGIPAIHHMEIFREFHQLDSTAREKGQGLGLGLAIVQRLAQLLGHSIELRSIPGKGSVFTVIVPASDNLERRLAWTHASTVDAGRRE